MNREDIRTDLIEELEGMGSFFSESQINNFIQEGYNESVLRSKLLESRYTLQFQSELTYYDFGSLITDYFRVNAIWNNSTQRWLEPKPLEWFDSIRRDWECMQGQPRYFGVAEYNMVAIVPRLEVATGSMDVFYNAKAATLEDTTTIQLPQEFDNLLVEYSKMAAMEQSREFTKALKYNEDYERDAIRLIRLMANRSQQRTYAGRTIR